jgi:hypothetical protein
MTGAPSSLASRAKALGVEDDPVGGDLGFEIAPHALDVDRIELGIVLGLVGIIDRRAEKIVEEGDQFDRAHIARRDRQRLQRAP